MAQTTNTEQTTNIYATDLKNNNITHYFKDIKKANKFKKNVDDYINLRVITIKKMIRLI